MGNFKDFRRPGWLFWLSQVLPMDFEDSPIDLQAMTYQGLWLMKLSPHLACKLSPSSSGPQAHHACGAVRKLLTAVLSGDTRSPAGLAQTFLQSTLGENHHQQEHLKRDCP